MAESGRLRRTTYSGCAWSLPKLVLELPKWPSGFRRESANPLRRESLHSHSGVMLCEGSDSVNMWPRGLASGGARDGRLAPRVARCDLTDKGRGNLCWCCSMVSPPTVAASPLDQTCQTSARPIVVRSLRRLRRRKWRRDGRPRLREVLARREVVGCKPDERRRRRSRLLEVQEQGIPEDRFRLCTSEGQLWRFPQITWLLDTARILLHDIPHNMLWYDPSGRRAALSSDVGCCWRQERSQQHICCRW